MGEERGLCLRNSEGDSKINLLVVCVCVLWGFFCLFFL